MITWHRKPLFPHSNPESWTGDITIMTAIMLVGSLVFAVLGWVVWDAFHSVSIGCAFAAGMFHGRWSWEIEDEDEPEALR